MRAASDIMHDATECLLLLYCTDGVAFPALFVCMYSVIVDTGHGVDFEAKVIVSVLC